METYKPTVESEKSIESMHKIYRGIWAEKLIDGQDLPIGGSVFSKELTTKLNLDFSTFDDDLKGFTEENIKRVYEDAKDKTEEWLNKINSDLDPYTFFLCSQIQQKVNKLLEVDPSNPTNSFERQKLYSKENSPKLSELIGKTECGERAALGQYILQKAGEESSYVSGITMQNINDNTEFPEDHSFLVLKNINQSDSTLIFDVARPYSQHNMPRILETDIPFNYDLLKNKEELLIGATEKIGNEKLWFGVGDTLSGHHETI